MQRYGCARVEAISEAFSCKRHRRGPPLVRSRNVLALGHPCSSESDKLPDGPR